MAVSFTNMTGPNSPTSNPFSFSCRIQPASVVLKRLENSWYENNIYCALDVVSKAIFEGENSHILEKGSPEALEQAGLAYVHDMCSHGMPEFLRLEAAANVFQRAALKYMEQRQGEAGTRAFTQALKSLDGIPKLSDRQYLSITLQKIEILEQMNVASNSCSPGSDLFFQYLDQRMYQESIVVARIYKRQAELIPHQIYPKGEKNPKGEHSFMKTVPALVKEAKFLIKAANYTDDIHLQIKQLNRAQVVLEKAAAVEKETLKNAKWYGDFKAAWPGDFQEGGGDAMLKFVKATLDNVNHMTVQTKTVWEAFKDWSLSWLD